MIEVMWCFMYVNVTTLMEHNKAAHEYRTKHKNKMKQLEHWQYQY
jgi:hypothetical protein